MFLGLQVEGEKKGRRHFLKDINQGKKKFLLSYVTWDKGCQKCPEDAIQDVANRFPGGMDEGYFLSKYVNQY